mgnify:CR=1 FL=1
MKNLIAMSCAAVLAFGSAAVLADDVRIDEAQKLITDGTIQSFEKLNEKALATRPGTITDSELEQEYGRYIYKVEIRDAQGAEWKSSRMNRIVNQVKSQQKAALRGFLCWPLLALLIGWSATAQAGRDIDQDEALYLVEQGVIQPLQKFIDDALKRYPGRFLEADLEWDDGRYVYELEIVTNDRRVLELEYDAVSGTLLDVDEDD